MEEERDEMTISRPHMPPSGGSGSRRLEMPLLLDDVLERIFWPDVRGKRVKAKGGGIALFKAQNCSGRILAAP